MLTWIAKNTDLPVGLQVVSLVASGTKLFLADQNNGIYKSSDDGVTWVAVNSDLPETNIISLLSCGFGVIASTFANGAYITSDDGESWTSIEGLSEFIALSIVQVGPVAYIGGEDYDGNGRIYSSDDGIAWEELTDGLPEYQSCLALTKCDGIVFASIKSTVTPGIYKLVDDVFEFVVNYQANSLVSNNDSIAAFTSSGQYYSIDDGATWTQFSITTGTVILISIFHGRKLYAGGYNITDTVNSPVIFSSSDGVTWEDLSSGLEGSPIGGLTSMGDKLFCCSNGVGGGAAGGYGYGLPPGCLPGSLSFSNIGSDSITVSWVNTGLGRARILVYGTSPIIHKPVNGFTYEVGDIFGGPNSVDIGSGGSGEGGDGGIVGYNGSSDTVAITGLDPGTTYYFYLFEYSGIGVSVVTPGNEIYYPLGLFDDETTDAYAPAPTAPILSWVQPITSLSSLSWEAVPNATSYELQITNIDLDPTFSSPVINLTGITDLSYALETFFKENTILSTGFSGSLVSRISTLQMIYSGHIYGDWVYFGGTEAYTTITEWGFSGGEWLSNLIVNMSEYIYGVRVRAVNGAGASDWSADGFQPQFAENQLTVNTVANVDGQVSTFNTDYGSSMDLRFDQPDVFGTYYFKSNIGNPVHGLADFKTLNFDIIQLV